MPARYLALIGFEPARERIGTVAAAAAERFGLVVRTQLDNVIVLTDRSEAPIRCGRGSIIVGRTWPRSFAQRPETPLAAADGSVATLVDEAWGDYVAFGQPAGASAVDILRAPAGGMPAYRVRSGALTVIASDVELILGLGLVSVAIDWSFVAHHLAFTHLRGGLTGLAGIDELLPGDCTTIDADGARRRSLWSPWQHARPEARFETIAAARAGLRQTVAATIACLAEPCASIMLELSGGLDSSVIAACLQPMAARVAALNLVTPSAEGDERRYARLIGAQTGIAVTEVPIPADIDLTSPVAKRTPRPGLPAMLRGIDAAFADAARIHGYGAFFSGTGGDNVFCSLGSSAPAADALRTFGPGRNFLRAVREVAELHDINVWRAATMAVRYARRPQGPAWPRTTHFLEVYRLPPTPLFHPWLIEPAGALGGTRSHIRSIMAALAHTDGYPRQAVAPSVFPLLAQPVIETCLRIPTWMWIDGGRDRAVARQAFQDILPPAVFARRSKGAMDSLCVRTFRNNRARLRAYLLDGQLSAAGLLDRPAVERYLGLDLPVQDDHFYRLLPIVDTESWLRGWLGDDRSGSA